MPVSTNLNDLFCGYWDDIFQEAEYGVNGDPSGRDSFTDSFSFSAALDPNIAPFPDLLGDSVLNAFSINDVEELIGLFQRGDGDDCCVARLKDGRYVYLSHGYDYTFSWQSIIVSSEWHHMISFGLGESERKLLGLKIDFCTEHEDCFYNLELAKECFNGTKR